MSEAVDLVGRLVDAFPNGRSQAPKSYIGALAATLCTYPRMVAVKCADPLQGVARETRFLPTIADVVPWCEREKQGLQRIVDREDYTRLLAEQAQERARETAALAEARTKRPTLQQMQEKYGPTWGLSAQEKQGLIVKAARDDTLRKANAAGFEAECREAGVDPARMTVSPSLLRILSRDEQEYEQRMRRAEALGREADQLTARQAAE